MRPCYLSAFAEAGVNLTSGKMPQILALLGKVRDYIATMMADTMPSAEVEGNKINRIRTIAVDILYLLGDIKTPEKGILFVLQKPNWISLLLHADEILLIGPPTDSWEGFFERFCQRLKQQYQRQCKFQGA